MQALPRPHGNAKGRRPRVILFIEENGGLWHAGRLAEALEDLGAAVTTATLKSCAFDTNSKTGLRIPGFDDELPDGAFVRSISTGTLEQITFRLGILHALSASGVRVWNDARVIERCVDKSTATFLFKRHGLPVPQTQTCERPDLAQTFLQNHTPLVSKPLFGSQGNGVIKINEQVGLPAPETLGHVYYLQRYIPPVENGSNQVFADWRVFVSAGRSLAAMTRKGKSWITNVHQGATPEPIALNSEMASLAVGAASAVGADYAGVDLIKAPDGRLLVLEINSNPAWKGLQSVTGVDIGTKLAQDFLEAVKRHNQKRTPFHHASLPSPATSLGPSKESNRTKTPLTPGAQRAKLVK